MMMLMSVLPSCLFPSTNIKASLFMVPMGQATGLNAARPFLLKEAAAILALVAARI